MQLVFSVGVGGVTNLGGTFTSENGPCGGKVKTVETAPLIFLLPLPRRGGLLVDHIRLPKLRANGAKRRGPLGVTLFGV